MPRAADRWRLSTSRWFVCCERVSSTAHSRRAGAISQSSFSTLPEEKNRARLRSQARSNLGSATVHVRLTFLMAACLAQDTSRLGCRREAHPPPAPLAPHPPLLHPFMPHPLPLHPVPP